MYVSTYMYTYTKTDTQNIDICEGVREVRSRGRDKGSLRRSVKCCEGFERKTRAQGVQETQLIAACGPPGGGRMEATFVLFS